MESTKNKIVQCKKFQNLKPNKESFLTSIWLNQNQATPSFPGQVLKKIKSK